MDGLRVEPWLEDDTSWTPLLTQEAINYTSVIARLHFLQGLDPQQPQAIS